MRSATGRAPALTTDAVRARGEPEADVWRRLPSSSGSTEHHVRRTDALSRLVQAPTLWWHWTERPTILLGAAQPTSLIDPEAVRRSGTRLERRESGGTTVYADSDLLGLDIGLPRGHSLVTADLVESYRWLGETWVEALHVMGVRARVVGVEEARASAPPSATVASILALACFGSLSPYEVVVGERKLVGLSQIRRGGNALWQSGIYLHFDAAALVRLLAVPEPARAARELEAAATDLHTQLGRVPVREEVIAAFSQALRERLGVEEMPGDWTRAEVEHARRVPRP